MLARTLILVLLGTSILANEYAWPIKASQSLSATFCEYRKGHLHAGIDIKTWGEMEVPCLAISDGYIERIIVNYNGYGRGLFLRTNEGHIAVYGHLEQFMPDMEKLVQEQQQKDQRYRVHLRFEPDEYPVKRGARVGYSGTSGTEHPHLHFELRDTSGTVFNPQAFYNGIKDTRAPIIDELLLIPGDEESKVAGSRQPMIVNPDLPSDPISITNQLRVAVNSHDRADGTYNKYSVYRAELSLDDSTVFRQTFDELPLALSDYVDLIYPGMRGKRGWRFMALYEIPDAPQMPFAWDGLHGNIRPSGVPRLGVKVADIKGNHKTAQIMLREQIPAQWEIRSDHDNYVVTRRYGLSGYQRYQFYSGDQTYIPISQTLHTLGSTEWYIPKSRTSKGVKALARFGGEILWLIPPPQDAPIEAEMQWYGYGDATYFRISLDSPHVFPKAFRLNQGSTRFYNELTQIDESTVESELIPLEWRCAATSLDLMLADSAIHTFDLDPLTRLKPQDSVSVVSAESGLQLLLRNEGNHPLFFQVDTISDTYMSTAVVGMALQILGHDSKPAGRVTSLQQETGIGLFKSRGKDGWSFLAGPDSAGSVSRKLQGSGEYFLINDSQAPVLEVISAPRRARPNQRFLFKIKENTGRLPRASKALQATLNGQTFFPDYNPLRKELSFHVPRNLKEGDHTFEISLSDAMGNESHYRHVFRVTR